MTYSFLDVQASIVGPGGAFSLGSGAGNAEEGITIEPNGDKDVMTIGADGSVLHSLVADKSGKVTVRLLKTSPVNAQLMAMYDAQSLSSRLWGNNTLTIANSVSGDVTTCRSVAFSRKPTITESKEAGTNEWEFNAGMIDMVLGVF
jgi:hypothetical protein